LPSDFSIEKIKTENKIVANADEATVEIESTSPEKEFNKI